MTIAELEERLRQALPGVEPGAQFVADLNQKLTHSARRLAPAHPEARWWWVLAGVGGAGLVLLGVRLFALLARRAASLAPAQPAQLHT